MSSALLKRGSDRSPVTAKKRKKATSHRGRKSPLREKPTFAIVGIGLYEISRRGSREESVMSSEVVLLENPDGSPPRNRYVLGSGFL